MIAGSNCHMICLCDVSWFDEFNKMAERKKAVKAGGQYCVAGATATHQLHTRYNYAHIPCRTVREVVMGQIRAKTPCRFRRTSEQVRRSLLAHFKKTCFENDMAWSIGFAKRRDLIVGSIPTRDTVIPEGPEVLSEQQKRQNTSHIFTC